MKGKTRDYLISGGFILACAAIIHFVVRSGDKVWENTLTEFKKDKILMDSIGGYKSFHYSGSENLTQDTTTFILTVYGKKADLTYKGKAAKTENGKWELVNFDKKNIIISSK